MSKLKPHIFVLLAVLVLLGMIVSPVCAAGSTILTGYQPLNPVDLSKDYFNDVTSISFDKSAEDKAIMLIHFKVPQEHTVNFVIYYGTNKSASGSATSYGNLTFSFDLTPITTTTSTIVFDGQTKSYDYFDTNPEFDYFLSGYGRNATSNATGIIVYNAGYASMDNDLAIFKEIPSISTNLIYRVDLNCDTPFDADISYANKSAVSMVAGKSITEVIGDWVALLLVIGGFLQVFIITVFAWAHFFFIKNIMLVVGLWFGVTMAFSAVTTVGNGVSVRNLERFYKKFFGYQRAMFEFMVSMWHTMIGLVSSLISAVGTAWPVIAGVAIGALILMFLGKLLG